MADADAVAQADLDRFRCCLSVGEQARCQRFVRAQRLRQFVVGRVLARHALGALLGVPWREVLLEEQVAGAPLLTAPATVGVKPSFSIAHSGRWVACAVSATTALGLDIELLDGSRDLDALAVQAFEAPEMKQWQAQQGLPQAQRVAGFYQLWSEKEARFKLGSDGYTLALAHAELSVVLCSARPLVEAPETEVVRLA